MTHKTGTREEWLAARLRPLDAEKELTPSVLMGRMGTALETANTAAFRDRHTR